MMMHLERIITARAPWSGDLCNPPLIDEKAEGRRWRRAIGGILRALGFVSFATVVLIVFTPFPYFLARLTSIPRRPEPADAIVVLSGGVEPNGALNDSSLRRALRGIALERRGLAPLLV